MLFLYPDRNAIEAQLNHENQKPDRDDPCVTTDVGTDSPGRGRAGPAPCLPSASAIGGVHSLGLWWRLPIRVSIL